MSGRPGASGLVRLLEENLPFFLVLLVLTANLLLYKTLCVNEHDVLVSAKHFADPSWIPNDWYLGQNIGYRSLFNVLAGLMARVMPLPMVSILGRFAVYVLFAAALQGLFRELRIHPLFAVPVAFVFSRRQSLVAVEWMVLSFEAKVLAYVCVLFALRSLLARRWGRMFLLSGLAMSFHVLVGGFAFFCLLFALLLNWKSFAAERGAMLRRSPLFVVSALPALYAVGAYLLESEGADSALAGYIYTMYRVGHHTFPGFWTWTWGPKVAVGVLAALAVAAWSSTPKRRILASYALGSFVPFTIGLGVYLAGEYHLLKFYWFRFADTLLPLFLLLAVSMYLGDTLGKRGESRPGGRWRWPPEGLGRIVLVAAVVFSLLAGASSAVRFDQGLRQLRQGGARFYLGHVEKDLLDAADWIRMNTAEDAAFLVNPAFEYFYLSAERAEFVSIKHSPQSDLYIIEWYDRIMQIQSGPRQLTQCSLSGLAWEVECAFFSMETDTIVMLGRKYGLEYYLGRSDRLLPLEIAYRNGSYILYRIDS